MPKEKLKFDELKTADLGHSFGGRWEVAQCCKSVYGGVSWPGKRPGMAVIVAMDKAKHFDSYDVSLLAEYESFSMRDLVRQLGVLDFEYNPEKWVGDNKNDAADKFVRELNVEINKGEEFKRHKKFRLTPMTTPMLEMKHFYQFALDEIKRLLDFERRTLFLKDSKIIGYLSEIEECEVADLDLGDYPAIEALCFAVITQMDAVKRDKKPQKPVMQDRRFKLGSFRRGA